MKYDVKLCELVRTAEIAADTYDFTVRAPELAAAAKPGPPLSVAHKKAANFR